MLFSRIKTRIAVGIASRPRRLDFQRQSHGIGSNDGERAAGLRKQVVDPTQNEAVLLNPTDRSNESTLRDVKMAAIGPQILAFEAVRQRQA
jgi:hypothetical protein